MIRVGLFGFSITFAMVKVLPEPVTPSKDWCFFPDFKFFTSCFMARGWSPAGLNGVFILNFSIDTPGKGSFGLLLFGYFLYQLFCFRVLGVFFGYFIINPQSFLNKSLVDIYKGRGKKRIKRVVIYIYIIFHNRFFCFACIVLKFFFFFRSGPGWPGSRPFFLVLFPGFRAEFGFFIGFFQMVHEARLFRGPGRRVLRFFSGRRRLALFFFHFFLYLRLLPLPFFNSFPFYFFKKRPFFLFLLPHYPLYFLFFEFFLFLRLVEFRLYFISGLL